MADLSDVEAALVSIISQIMGPIGTPGNPNVNCRVFRGQPTVGGLVSDRALGVVDIGITPVPGETRNTTRWNSPPVEVSGAATISVVNAGSFVTFSGPASPGDLAGVLIGGKSYVYTSKGGESGRIIAAALARMVQADRVCWLIGSTVSVPVPLQISGRTGQPVQYLQEVGRQEQTFRVSVWAGDPATRDQVSGAVGGTLANIAFLTLGTGEAARVKYRDTAVSDSEQGSSVFRRDLLYDVEYSTSIIINTTTMMFGDAVLNGSDRFS